uniref:Argonaute linker 1 domain-containing protein n=1 Tax=Rhizophagus irregularis (strain DAOM 181602 / DAOM 197198 / MUCL 43194) TaxID=747089 RepID=U9TA47_RHIID
MIYAGPNPLPEITGRKFKKISFYTLTLSGGIEAWQGYYQLARLTKRGRLT